jgi:hypothetical protein
MPNWCDNSLSVSHSDPAMIDRFMAAVAADNLFGEFAPLQESGEWDYNLAVQKWGTKWEACDAEFERSDNSITGYFMSAWAPPTGFYAALVELGFDVEAHYHEPGMAFAGVFTNDGEVEYVYDFTDPNWRDEIDDEVILDWLESEYENFEMWIQEDQEQEADNV